MKAKSYGAIRRQVQRDHARDIPAAARPDWRALWATRKAQWVEATWIAMMRDPYRQRTAYYTPAAGSTWGELHTVIEGEEPPAGAELITAERIPSGDRATIGRWLEQYAGRLPVIPEGV